MKDPILITGCSRSGTSATAGIINICGAFGGDLINPNNKGIFENFEIRQNLLKSYLKLIKSDPQGQNPLPDLTNKELVRQLEEDGRKWWNYKVENIIIKQGYTEGEWFFKGSKICLVWPLWNSAFPSAKWVLVRRSSEDIITSCLKTGFMKGYRTKEGWEYWVRIHETRFAEMRDAGLNIIEVWPEKFINGDFTEIRKVVEYIGLSWNEKAAKEFITPILWKGEQNG